MSGPLACHKDYQQRGLLGLLGLLGPGTGVSAGGSAGAIGSGPSADVLVLTAAWLSSASPALPDAGHNGEGWRGSAAATRAGGVPATGRSPEQRLR